MNERKREKGTKGKRSWSNKGVENAARKDKIERRRRETEEIFKQLVEHSVHKNKVNYSGDIGYTFRKKDQIFGGESKEDVVAKPAKQ